MRRREQDDTLGLEVAYLATGQARRADAIREAMANCANSARVPTMPAKVYSSAHWCAWSISTTKTNSSFLARLSVGPRGRLARLDNLLEEHGAYGLLRHDAADVIARVASHVRKWRTRFEGFGVSTQRCDRVESALMRPRDVGVDVIERALKPRA
jgi:hypothetical protein